MVDPPSGVALHIENSCGEPHGGVVVLKHQFRCIEDAVYGIFQRIECSRLLPMTASVSPKSALPVQLLSGGWRMLA